VQTDDSKKLISLHSMNSEKNVTFNQKKEQRRGQEIESGEYNDGILE
jgi:ribosome-associated protein YbcJ (S4-like RNA binding protein)